MVYPTAIPHLSDPTERQCSFSSRPLQHPRHGFHRAPDVFTARLPVAHAYTHRAFSTPRRAAEKGLTGSGNRGDHLICPAIVVIIRSARPGIEKTYQPLVDLRLPQDFRTRQTADERY